MNKYRSSHAWPTRHINSELATEQREAVVRLSNRHDKFAIRFIWSFEDDLIDAADCCDRSVDCLNG